MDKARINKNYMTALSEKLSIFIPTYNRWDILFQTLSRLVKYLPKGVRVNIVNNASTNNEYRNKVDEFIKTTQRFEISIIDYAVNIGGEGNFLRCVELCETEYIWVLGDDDFIIENAFSNLEHFLGTDQKYGWINFFVKNNYDNKVLPQRSFNSPFALIDYAPNWAKLIYISSNIYSTDLLKKGLLYGHSWQATCSILVVSLCKGWEELDKNVALKYHFCVSDLKLIDVDYHAKGVVPVQHYDQVDIYLKMPLLRFVTFSDPRAFSLIRKSLRKASKKVFKPRVFIKHLAAKVDLFGYVKSILLLKRTYMNMIYMAGFSRASFYFLKGVLLLSSKEFIRMVTLKK